MTLDDLNKIFDAAVAHSKATNREDLPDEAHRRAGTRAIVEALRGEIRNTWNDDTTLEQIFNAILGEV